MILLRKTLDNPISQTYLWAEQELATLPKLEGLLHKLRNIQKAKDISKTTETTADGLPNGTCEEFYNRCNQLEQEVNGVLEINKYASNTDSSLSDNQKYA